MSSVNKKTQLNGIFQRLRGNKDGVAAVEFALIVPLLITLYLGTVEISQAITVNKRIARVASTVGDLVTQVEEVSRDDLQGIFDIGAAVMFPYRVTSPEMTVIGVNVTSSSGSGGRVAWSRSYRGGSTTSGPAPNSEIFVPNRLRVDGTFIVKVIADIEYRPVTTWVLNNNTSSGNKGLNMSEEYWLRPRLTSSIDCTNC